MVAKITIPIRRASFGTVVKTHKAAATTAGTRIFHYGIAVAVNQLGWDYSKGEN